jgi:hypothetical protein
MSLLLATGNPAGTGANPHTGEELGLNDIFWIVWYTFTPDIRACAGSGASPYQSQGSWNIVNANQITNFSDALKQEVWVEGVDGNSSGPRYFFGYTHHFHNKRSVSPRHSSVSGTSTERSFLTHRAREKGLVFASIWNDYEESIVLEPAVRVGVPPDSHVDATAGGSFLSNFMQAALKPENPRLRPRRHRRRSRALAPAPAPASPVLTPPSPSPMYHCNGLQSTCGRANCVLVKNQSDCEGAFKCWPSAAACWQHGCYPPPTPSPMMTLVCDTSTRGKCSTSCQHFDPTTNSTAAVAAAAEATPAAAAFLARLPTCKLSTCDNCTEACGNLPAAAP